MRYFIPVTIIVCFCSAAAWGQAKVGTSGGAELYMIPSVRAGGMGDAGTALAGDDTYYMNPSLLGLMHADNRLWMSFSPIRARYLVDGIRQNFVSFSTRVLKGDLIPGLSVRVNAAYHLNRVKEEYELTSHEYGGTGEDLILRTRFLTHNYTFSASVRHFVQVSAGINIKVIDEDYQEFENDGDAIDFGLALRLPDSRIVGARNGRGISFYISPVVGLSLLNRWGTMKVNGYTYDLDSKRIFGVSSVLGLATGIDSDRRTLLALVPAFAWDVDYPPAYYGAELQIFEAAAVRGGWRTSQYEYPRGYNYSTWGLGIMSRGMARHITDLFFRGAVERGDSFVAFLRERINVRFTFAQQVREHTEQTINYYGISIEL